MNTSTKPIKASADSHGAASRRRWLGRWGGRLGAAAFLFFLIKGLAWLIVPALIALWAAW